MPNNYVVTQPVSVIRLTSAPLGTFPQNTVTCSRAFLQAGERNSLATILCYLSIVLRHIYENLIIMNFPFLYEVRSH